MAGREGRRQCGGIAGMAGREAGREIGWIVRMAGREARRKTGGSVRLAGREACREIDRRKSAMWTEEARPWPGSELPLEARPLVKSAVRVESGARTERGHALVRPRAGLTLER